MMAIIAGVRPTIRTARVTGISRAGLPTQSGLSTTVKIYGVRVALAKLRLVGQIAYRDMGLITYRGAKAVERKAKENIHPHRNSGNLEEGIRASKIGPYDWRVTASSRDGGSDREYAAHVEYGTRFMSAIPYMRPAVDQARPETQLMLSVLAAKLERL